MIVVFLAGIVALIMIRTLKMDYLRYSKSIAEIGSAGNSDDYGWKRVHGDVFRPSPYHALYCVLFGTGAHVAVSLSLSLIIIVLTTHYLGRGCTYAP